MEFRIHRHSGKQVISRLSDAARLRITIFRDFPYLYDGDETAEKDYLIRYAECSRSVFVIAEAAGSVVGISSGLPLADAEVSFRRPFENAGLNLTDWFYFGESVLELAWRGKGIGHRFFDEREAHAMDLGFTKVCFCAVERPADHPLKPDCYRSHDIFWGRRGFNKRPELRARFSWPQIDSAGADVKNELVFWTRDLTG